MPEIAEVANFADGLRKCSKNHYISGLFYDESSRYNRAGMNNVLSFDKELPLKILDVTSRGKKIIFTLENDIYLVSSLGLEGRWDQVFPDETIPDDKHSNLWLSISEKKERRATPSGKTEQQISPKCDYYLFYTDSRHFGELKICLNAEELADVMKKVGKDLLKDEITKEFYIETMRIKKYAKKPICEVLMDQEKIAGIGNWIRVEVLYDAKINPWRLVEDLSDEELDSIRLSSIRIVNEAYGQGGASLRTYKNFEGQKGTYIVQVYGKKDDKDVKCKYDKQKRNMWWHSKVQK